MSKDNLTQKENWIDAMTEREALPPQMRSDTVEEFCEKYDIGTSTYYYQRSKDENQDKIISLSLRYAKKHTSEVLDNLGERAKADNKATEIYLKFVLDLAERKELTGKDGKDLIPDRKQEINNALNDILNESTGNNKENNTGRDSGGEETAV